MLRVYYLNMESQLLDSRNKFVISTEMNLVLKTGILRAREPVNCLDNPLRLYRSCKMD